MNHGLRPSGGSPAFPGAPVHAATAPGRDADPVGADRAVDRLPARLRILFVVSDYPVLSEVFVLNNAAALLADGHDVQILALYAAEPALHQHAVHPVQTRWSLDARVRRVRHAHRPAARLLRLPADLATLLGRTGMQGLRVLDPRRFAGSALSGRALQEALQLGDFDLVHCQFGMLGEPILRHREAGLLRGRVVVHFRGHDISARVVGSANPYSRVFRDADRLITNCRFFQDRLVQLGADPGRVDVVPSGVDLAGFPFRGREAVPHSPLRLLGVGRLVGKKGFGDAIDALALLVRSGIDARLELVGDGPLEHALLAQAARLGVADRLELAGALPHDQLAVRLAQSSVFLAPSVTSDEGDQDAPVNTLKEAMAAGIPVVATRHGGIPELVEDQSSGLLVPEHDGPALAEAILRLAREPGLAERLVVEARATVERDWSIEVSHRRLTASYAKALGVAPAETNAVGRSHRTREARTAIPSE